MSASTDADVLETIEVQQQLDEKDQLIVALTERLEEAAEQLDRVQRSGALKGGRTSGDKESSAQQRSLVEQLTQSTALWEGVQPKDAFERIETRLDDLRSLLESSTTNRPVTVEQKAPATKAPAPPANLAGWEKMKAQLLGDEPPECEEIDTQASSTSASGVLDAGIDLSGSTEAVGETPPTLDDLALPAPVDFDEAEREELEEAIEERDDFITFLIRRLRTEESRTHQPVDWDALNNAPDELRETLEQLEADLNDRLRIAEVDVSLERARLSRVETRISGMQQQIEKKLRSAGMKLRGKPGEEEEAAEEPSLSKSWFGSLGR